MANKITQANLSQLSINPKFALKLYEAVVKEGLESCVDQLTFIQTVKDVVHIFLRFDDYIQSNNLLQIAKSEFMQIEAFPWYQFAALQVLTKRVPKYIINHPEYLLKKLEFLIKDPDYYEKIEGFMFSTIESFLNFLPFFSQDYRILVRTFAESIYQSPFIPPLVHEKILELKLQAIPHTLPSSAPQKRAIEPLQETTSNVIRIKDQKIKILIIGELAMKKADVHGIGKDFGFSHQQIEFVDYEETKHYAFRKLDSNMNYAGIILGPVPHMVQDLDDHTSLVQLLGQPGYPHTFVARVESELKLSKNILKKGFADVVSHYNSNG